MKAIDKATEPSVSPQVDVIIVDTLVPHSLWLVDKTQGIEIVPEEAVVGIIEVKRTLDATSLSSALIQLRHIFRDASLRKDDPAPYLPGGVIVGPGLRSPYRGNPFIGIIGLASSGKFAATPSEEVANALANLITDGSEPLLLDFVLCLSGIFVATADPSNPSNYHPSPVRIEPATHWAEASPRTNKQGRVAVAQGLGFILAFLNNACGRSFDPEKYFFNVSIG